MQFHIIFSCIFRLHRATIINRIKDLNYGSSRIGQIIIHLKFSVCPVCIILICKNSIFINISISDQLKQNHTCRCRINNLFIAFTIFYHFVNKKISSNSSWSVNNSFRNFTLKPFCKTIIAFTGNNSQYINIMNIISKHISIHTLSIFVNTKSKTTPNFLTLSNFTVALLQSTNLKYIWIIPTFTQSRMRKDKSYRRFLWISV